MIDTLGQGTLEELQARQTELLALEPPRTIWVSRAWDVEIAEAAADDEALTQALLLVANDNRVAQYGEEDVTDES